MKLANIVPEAHLELSKNMHMVLAHEFMTRPQYAEYYIKKSSEGDEVILDNSAYEKGCSINAATLALIAKELKPTHLILPDKRFDQKATVALVKDFQKVDELASLNCKLLAVPQGNDLKSVVACYEELSKLQFIDGFAIYEEIGQVTKLGDGSRADFCSALQHWELIHKDFYYHMLGCEENLNNTKRLVEFPWINSIDTAKAVVYGLNDMDILDSKNYEKYPHRPKDYFDIKEIAPMCIQNIRTLEKWLNNSNEEEWKTNV
jgi:hypothetical protein